MRKAGRIMEIFFLYKLYPIQIIIVEIGENGERGLVKNIRARASSFLDHHLQWEM